MLGILGCFHRLQFTEILFQLDIRVLLSLHYGKNLFTAKVVAKIWLYTWCFSLCETDYWILCVGTGEAAVLPVSMNHGLAPWFVQAREKCRGAGMVLQMEQCRSSDPFSPDFSHALLPALSLLSPTLLLKPSSCLITGVAKLRFTVSKCLSKFSEKNLSNYFLPGTIS